MPIVRPRVSANEVWTWFRGSVQGVSEIRAQALDAVEGAHAIGDGGHRLALSERYCSGSIPWCFATRGRS